MPAAAITSASPSFAHVMPIAPAAICICAISGVLCAFECGRHATPFSRQRGDDARDVRFHDVEIDQQRRRIERGLRLADQSRDESVLVSMAMLC